MSLKVLQGGVLSLLQDSGRMGQHQLGLTNGGPMDAEAFHYLNRLLQNDANSTAIEISVGGLQLEARTSTYFCVAGAPMPLSVNGEEKPLWSVHPIHPGDIIELGYAERGCRTYLGVADGFSVTPIFGSTATVVREGIGGLSDGLGDGLSSHLTGEQGNGLKSSPNGMPLTAGNIVPCPEVIERKRLCLPAEHQPRYHKQLTVRVIPGYQRRDFSRLEKRRFFGAAYTVSERYDRMGYKLEGAPVACAINGILSEGICLGAIQIPPDGNPLVLMNDRQTIGGYPKIGAALSLDLSRLAQLGQGGTVHFAPISRGTAMRALHLAQRFGLNKPLREF